MTDFIARPRCGLRLRTLAKPCQYEAAVEWINTTISVCVSGIAIRVACTDWTTEASEDEARIERVHRAVAIEIGDA